MRAVVDDRVDGKVVGEMFERGVRTLTGTDMQGSFRLLFSTDDVVGIKVNPVGAPLISTKPEVVEAVIRWLVDNGLPKGNIVIWDRFDGMLKDAGFTAERFPGVAHRGAADDGRGGQLVARRRRPPRLARATSTRTPTTSPRASSARACAATRTTSTT